MIDHQPLFGAAGLQIAKLGEIMDNAAPSRSPLLAPLVRAKEAFSRETAVNGARVESVDPVMAEALECLDVIRQAILVDPEVAHSILRAARLYFDERERLAPRPPGERWKEHIEFSPWRRLGVDRSTYKRLRILGALAPGAGERPRRKPKRGYPVGWRPSKAVASV